MEEWLDNTCGLAVYKIGHLAVLTIVDNRNPILASQVSFSTLPSEYRPSRYEVVGVAATLQGPVQLCAQKSGSVYYYTDGAAHSFARAVLTYVVP